MKQLFCIVIIAFLFLGHPLQMDAAAEDKQTYKNVEQIESYIDQSQWMKASLQSKQLEKWFGKNKWKLQLLGDEAEYEGIEQDIQKLKSAVEEKDITQSKLIISELKVRLKAIYSF